MYLIDVVAQLDNHGVANKENDQVRTEACDPTNVRDTFRSKCTNVNRDRIVWWSIAYKCTRRPNTGHFDCRRGSGATRNTMIIRYDASIFANRHIDVTTRRKVLKVGNSKCARNRDG